MNDSLFVSLDRLLLEFVFQYEQDISTKEDMLQRINKCLEDIKENKATICKIHETINTTDEEIGHYCKHSKEIKDNCSNWKPTCDVFHKHEDYMQDQFTICQETIEKDKKMYHGYICQYKDVLKQYQLKYSETPLSQEYYKKKREHEEIQNRVLACTEQLKINETIFMEFLVPAPFPSLTKWTLHMANMRFKTQDILKHASDYSKSSSELKKEVDEVEIEINYLNQQIARLHETKNLGETLEEKNKNIEKIKELKEKDRIFEKDEQPALILNKTPQNSQLFLPYESQKLVRLMKMHSSEPRVIDKKEESSVKQAKLANIDFRQKENNVQVLNDFTLNDHSKCSNSVAIKNSQNMMHFRLLTPQKPSNCSQWFEKGDTDAESEDQGTVRQLRESKCTSQVICAEHFEKPIENNSDEVEERAENFLQTSEIPLFLKTPEAVKTPEPLEKLFPKTPPFEINRNIMPESQTQKESPGFSFLKNYTSRSPGLNLFDSTIFDSEISSDQFNENYSAGNLNPLSSQQEIGNLFGKPGEDAFTFSFSSDSSTHTFGTGKDDFSFPFSFEQDQNSTPSVKGFSSSSQSTTQFTFF
ncbi:protein SIX6OS1 isoform X1 [Mustela erminea]|uniref:protein SIX6OS1 isoform X1 n=2 Tax=Mustela erminea TaxID=36723 RepID=UPI001386C465|nr:protein SIX6OS1 isoform X1 [Mustela erminea]XP_032200281.1 protein SIX6OS1 isoform X1 [Mustela erminea]XP_032200282.1 protein SIX6OS1 isoform X1 [Mustela erminea]XP_032200283.1 protein SIX6OS1 isoform X1 [Mustela erminea]XP_032200284.1 protein SIX6OS1 isoform X1 [Mustela erminea]XP_032200287.1 protein SIX6OS1 isoform X1 [Mustela erminea]